MKNNLVREVFNSSLNNQLITGAGSIIRSHTFEPIMVGRNSVLEL